MTGVDHEFRDVGGVDGGSVLPQVAAEAGESPVAAEHIQDPERLGGLEAIEEGCHADRAILRTLLCNVVGQPAALILRILELPRTAVHFGHIALDVATALRTEKTQQIGMTVSQMLQVVTKAETRQIRLGSQGCICRQHGRMLWRKQRSFLFPIAQIEQARRSDSGDGGYARS